MRHINTTEERNSDGDIEFELDLHAAFCWRDWQPGQSLLRQQMKALRRALDPAGRRNKRKPR